MIFTLVAINFLRRDSVERWMSCYPFLSLLHQQLRGDPPKALGKITDLIKWPPLQITTLLSVDIANP
ncbi:MAG: hypothetical protein GY934_25390 [Gammaproteobacteria bacterium]|nr:hypothetical protein [Gammaproteobacteria bacterium]